MVNKPKILKVHTSDKYKSGSDWLEAKSKIIKSQAGQDGMIEHIFSIMKPENNWCVEFGAWDGEHFSNTWHLINNLGWSGVLIEGGSERWDQLSERYINREDVICINEFIGFDKGLNTIDDLLSRTNCPLDLDFMSIDIDGNDWHVWDSMEKFKPRLLMIEFNYTAGHELYSVQDKDFNLNESNSLVALVELGKVKGYELIAANADLIFVRKEYYHLFDISDNSARAMYDFHGETYLFQGFDGSILTAGCKRLVWQGININDEDIQILPVESRKIWWSE